MNITEKELLELFSHGIDCLSERRIVNYKMYKEIRELLKENKIIIKIKNYRD